MPLYNLLVKLYSLEVIVSFTCVWTCTGTTPDSCGGHPSPLLCRGGAAAARHARVAQVMVRVPSAATSPQLTPRHSLD